MVLSLIALPIWFLLSLVAGLILGRSISIADARRRGEPPLSSTMTRSPGTEHA